MQKILAAVVLLLAIAAGGAVLSVLATKSATGISAGISASP